MDWLKRRADRKVDEQEQRGEDESLRLQEQDEHENEVVDDYGVVRIMRNGRVEVNVKDAAEAKVALKALRLRKKELQGDRDLMAEDVRTVRAGRAADGISTVGMGRATAGRVDRAGVADKRRRDRMQTESAVSAVERRGYVLDDQIDLVDRAITEIEAYTLQRTVPPAER